MNECKHYNQQRGRGQEAIHWVCSDCGATITADDWKAEQVRLVAEGNGVAFYERGGASPGITPCGRLRLETRTGPYAPTVEEMRAAKVDPEAPQKGQQVFTVAFGVLYWDGERWCSLAD